MSAGELALLFVGAMGPSVALAWLATRLMRWLAPAWGLVDVPNQRKVHTSPTPMGGGLGIWFGVVATFAIGQLALGVVTMNESCRAALPAWVAPHLDGLWFQVGRLWILLGCGTALMILGLLDDRRGLSWQVRIAVEFAVAATSIWLVPQLQLTAFVPIPGLTFVLSVIWIVALVNSFNMLDNMDGLSAGTASISGLMLASVLLLAPDPQTHKPQLFVAGFLLVLVGSLLGFLFHNRPPAKIFMGDAGSYFIGFTIAVATLLSTYTSFHGEKRHAILAPLLVLAVPLYDMVTVIWIRVRSGRSPFHADKNHFSHRLVDLGLTKTQAVLTVYLTSAACGLGALLLHRLDFLGAVIVLLMVFCTLALIAILEMTGRSKAKT